MSRTASKSPTAGTPSGLPADGGTGRPESAVELPLEPGGAPSDLDPAFYEAILRLDCIEIACRFTGARVADARALADQLVAYVGTDRAVAELRLACVQRAIDHIQRLNLTWDPLETAQAFEAYARNEAAPAVEAEEAQP